MNNHYLKLIVGGILFGSAVFFAPFFILPFLGIFLFFGMMRWFFGGPRRHHYAHFAWAHADRIRNMSDEEYTQYKQKRHACTNQWSNEKKEENE